MLIRPPNYKNHPIFNRTSLSLAFLLCLLLLSNSLYADRSFIKCWKNADGLTECGNRIPREYYNQRIRYIDDKGITRKVKERSKTREELDEQFEADKLQALEAKQQQKIKEYDEVLLKTYLKIDDLLASLNSKLAIIESRSIILDSSIELKKREFGNLIRKAANMERSGKPISKSLSSQLDSTRTTLRNLQNQVSIQEIETAKIKKVFAHDVERFILSKAERIKYTLSTPSQAKKLHAVRVNCLNEAQCDLQWQKANDFIKEFASTKPIYTTDKVSVTDIPKTHNDIAMSLSILDDKSDRQPNDNKLIIFQIRCNPDRKGQEFCASSEINNLLKEFKSIIYQQ
ncbi:hypothetical protein [sulfur-oxidizing endosymbiont of Gigantopelta aegis]|uniref:hypothetical protein n=1 Tax=sulfur-oxidizing endosymbiont of Gigantopelta aegis TaxID=2794934 RepID=UPI0018DDDB21|nr:hypothetical protein [sulfur-oxidizing endosymbiont of Gigantopelta aegis]